MFIRLMALIELSFADEMSMQMHCFRLSSALFVLSELSGIYKINVIKLSLWLIGKLS